LDNAILPPPEKPCVVLRRAGLFVSIAPRKDGTGQACFAVDFALRYPHLLQAGV
jgi:hypothetical protein